MPEPLKYQPEPEPTHQSAREELDALLETLHRSGTLRVLNGLFGRFSEVTEVIVTQLNEPRGRNLLGNLTVMLTSLGDSDPTRLERMMSGLLQGLGALETAASRRTPGMFSLFMLLRHPDTRRGIYALARLLQGIGHELRPAPKSEPQREERALPAREPVRGLRPATALT